jgi:hypothetical protein
MYGDLSEAEKVPQYFDELVPGGLFGDMSLSDVRNLYKHWQTIQKTDPYDAYHRLAGEVEARNVQTRMGLLPDDRRMLPPWATEDVAPGQQIVRMEGGGASMSAGRPRKVVRYETKSGRGLMNNEALDRSRLTDDEEFELDELMDFGLEQPRDVQGGALFAFTEDGEKQHKRLLQLLKKASKEKVVRKTYNITDPAWESSDGQVAFLPGLFEELGK